MGEKIAWGSDTDLMNEAADIIESLETAIKKVSDYNLRLETQIQEMKDCVQCVHYDSFASIANCIKEECRYCNDFSNWQLKQSDDNE